MLNNHTNNFADRACAATAGSAISAKKRCQHVTEGRWIRELRWHARIGGARCQEHQTEVPH